MPDTAFVPLAAAAPSAAAPAVTPFRPRPVDAASAPVVFRSAPVAGPAEAVPFRATPLGVPSDADRAAREQGRAEGFAAGFAAGAREAAVVAHAQAQQAATARAAAAADAAAATEQALDVLTACAAAARARTEPVVAEVQTRLQAAALELAQALLGVELADDERSGRAALTRALRHADGIEDLVVRLHPRDLAALRACGADAARDGVVLVADPAVTPGDALAEHADGYLDARLTTALDRARAALTGETR